jgi:hypothetical protein
VWQCETVSEMYREAGEQLAVTIGNTAPEP